MKLIISQKQLNEIKETVEGIKTKDTKDKLYFIATVAYNLWKSIDDNDELDGSLISKIDDIEMNVRAVARGHNSDEYRDGIGISSVSTDDLIIGK